MATTTARPTRAGPSSTTARRRGSRPTAAWTAESDQAGACFGCSVATAGDVNGDGYSDVIVGAHQLRQRPDRRGAGLRLPRLGRGPRHHRRLDRGERTRPTPSSASSVATAGDVNGDGFSDVIVGAYALRQRPDRRGAGLRLPRLGGGPRRRPPPGPRSRTRPTPTSASRWRRRAT